MSSKGSPAIVKLAIFTLITVVIWIAFDVYRAFTVKPSPDVSAEVLLKLNPMLDEVALNQLQNRVYISDEQIRNNIFNLSTDLQPELEFLEEIPSEPATEATSEGQLEQ